MIVEPIFVDVNIPMYAAGRPHRYREASIWILKQVADGRLDATIDTEIIQEVLHRYGALQAWATAAEMAEGLLELIPHTYAVTPEDVRLAAQLLAEYGPTGVKARDVIHAAVMRNQGITHIVSTDQHFDRIDGITRLDPITFFEAES